MRITLSILLLSVCYPVTVDGYAYLENQTDHSGIKVLFERTIPTELKDSTYTDANGYYNIALEETGVYTITYFKETYYDYTIYSELINDQKTFSEITLKLHSTLKYVPTDYETIQFAIDSSWTGDTIIVEPGVYYKRVRFNTQNIILASRYFLTGDTNYIIETILDGSEGGGNNGIVGFGLASNGIPFSSGNNNSTILSGFTIKNAYDVGGFGGGIFCINSSPTLDHLYIEDNWSGSSSGGISLSNSHPVIKNTIITRNYGSPGGIGCFKSSPTIMDVIIDNNRSNLYGSGMIISSSSPTLTNVIISNNIVEKSATDFWVGSGSGSGIYIVSSGSFNPVSYPSLTNVTIISNYAEENGGGIFCTDSYPSLNHVIISGNVAFESGGGIYSSNCGINIINSIVSHNSNDQIYQYWVYQGENLNISYSNIFGSYNISDDWFGENVQTNVNADSCDFYYNVNLDPMFCNPTNGDFSLASNSPCIGSAENASNIGSTDIGCDDSEDYLITLGCNDVESCNYNTDVTINNGSCLYGDCNGDCTCEKADGSGGENCAIYDYCNVCGGNQLDSMYFDCIEDCAGVPGGFAELDDCGECGGDNSTCTGCTNSDASNYNPEATMDDGSCELSLFNGLIPEDFNLHSIYPNPFWVLI